MAQNSLRLVEDKSVDKSKALEAALSQIERAFGKGSIMKLGSKDSVIEIETIPTGSLGLDIALGVGGLPKGRIIEIYGPESSGKTTLALQTIAEAQKKGGICGFVDAEHALDPVYARKLGVDLENLLISQPDTGEQALEIVDTLVRSGALDVLVIDSVAALVPRAEIEGEMGDSLPGMQARLMSQALRKLTASISKSNCMVIFINQIRMKIGVMFGSPETTTGGNALKFYASVRLDIRRIGAVKDREEVVGNQTRVKVVKNKMARPSSRSNSTSCMARACRRPASSSISASRPASSRSRGPGSPITASASARAAKTPSSSCATIPMWRARSKWRCARMPASSPTSSWKMAARKPATIWMRPICEVSDPSGARALCRPRRV